MVKVWKARVLAAGLCCVSCGADTNAPDLPPQGGTQSGQGGSQSGGSGAGGGSGGTSSGTGGTASPGGGSGSDPSRCFPVPEGQPLVQVLATPVTGTFYALGSTNVKMDDAGRVLIAGAQSYEERDVVVGRLLPDGSTDPDFGNGGERQLPFQNPMERYVHALEVDADGRIWVGGLQEQELSDASSAFVARLLETGDLDTSFNAAGSTPGILTFRPRADGPTTAEFDAVVRSIAPSSAGTFLNGDPPFGFLERLLDDGSYDPAFNVSATTFDGDLKVLDQTLFMLAAAYEGPDLSAWSLDGMPQTAFGNAGVVALREGFDPLELLQTADGRFIVASSSARFARLDGGGSLDTTFGTDGYTASSDCLVNQVSLLCDGTSVALGRNVRPLPEPNLYCAVAYDADGQLLDGAPPEGMYTWEPPDLISSQVWLFVDPTGHIVAVSERDQTFHFERYVPPWASP